jgi:hypothetical protein
MLDDWALAMYAAAERDTRAVEPGQGGDVGTAPNETVRWDRVPTPGGGWIDHQLVSGRVDGRRRRLQVIDYHADDPEHAQRIHAALDVLAGTG